MNLTVQQKDGFNYIEEGQGESLVLLHGLFGALSNWEHVLRYFSSRYRVIIPLIPIYEIPLKEANMNGLVAIITNFITLLKLDKVTLIGNSLGGHIGLIYTLENPSQVFRLVLTASSGLYENNMGRSFIKRSNYEYVAERVRYTFYDPGIVTKEYIDEVFNSIQDRDKIIRLASIAKSAQRDNLATRLPEIQMPTLLIWGLNDTITPPLVAHEFNTLIPNSCLRFIDKCCHAPMMEHPDKFNYLLEEFLIATAQKNGN